MARRFLLSPRRRLPCNRPPWGTLTAIVASTGEVKWESPLGRLSGTENVAEASQWGSISLGGPIVTAGGLVFMAGTLDPAIYAFDVQSGASLWKGDLPTSARSTPMTYRAANGKQYVVVSAGGHGIAGGAPLGDYLVAFSLP
jgi:quinoprotein glucose dehydrogenase